jgi:flagellin
MALRYMARQGGNDQNVIKKFMSVLVTEGAGSLDKAVGFATGGRIGSWTELGQKFSDDYSTYGGDNAKFLAEKCGIINATLGAKDDTGAITGSDAGGSHIDKTSSSVVPEGGSTRFWYAPTTEFTVIEGLKVHWNTSDMDAGFKASAKDDVPTIYDTEYNYMSKTGSMSLQVGTKANQNIAFGFLDMTAEGLGLQDTKGNKIQVTTREQATEAIRRFDQSVRKALAQQTNIGALQSRLEYTSANITTASENTQGSESTIRDADMAKEMTAYTKNNVLLQAAQSMLAQANQNSSNVLGLLQ